MNSDTETLRRPPKREYWRIHSVLGTSQANRADIFSVARQIDAFKENCRWHFLPSSMEIESENETIYVFHSMSGKGVLCLECDFEMLRADEEACIGRLLREDDPNVRIMSTSRIACGGGSSRFPITTWLSASPVPDLPFGIPEDREAQQHALREILRDIHYYGSPMGLAEWFQHIAETGLVPEEGLTPDVPALAIFKQILKLDWRSALQCADISFTASGSSHFSPGRFQLAILGALASYFSGKKTSSGIALWVYQKIEAVKTEPGLHLGSRQTGSMVLAALIGLALLADENTSTGAARIDQTLKGSLERISQPEITKFFLQFLSDALGQFINEENIAKHFLKIIALCDHLKEGTVFWSDRGLASLLKKKIIDPTHRLLSGHRE